MSNKNTNKNYQEEEQTYSNLDSLQGWLKDVKAEEREGDAISLNESVLEESNLSDNQEEAKEIESDHEEINQPKRKKKLTKKRREDFSDEGEYNEINVNEDEELSEAISDVASEESHKQKKFTNKKRQRNQKKTKSSKRKRPSATEFLEMEASSDEDEESEGGDGEVSKVEQEKIRKKLYERRDKIDILPSRKRLDILHQTEEEIKERYAHMEEDNMQEYEDGEGQGQQSKQPSISDPKLWLVKCRAGKEKESVQNLFHKYFSCKTDSDTVKILSVMCFDSLKGAIYVEAFKEANVREAIQGISTLRESSIKIVPITEMIQVFNLDQVTKFDLKPKQWVRLKTGLYENDLAQVVHIEDPVNKVYVRIIPRIAEENYKDSLGDYSKKLKKSVRPRQKLFNPQHFQEVVSKMHPVLREQVYAWNKMTFKDGFLIKSVKAKSLLTDDVVPSIEELRVFDFARMKTEGGSNLSNLDTDCLITSLQDTQISKKKKFAKGDKIKIIKGGLKGLTGRVDSHQDGVVSIIADVDGINDLIEQPEDYIVKEFLPGDLVKVVMGSHVGKHGLIVKVDDDTAYIFSDSTNSEFSVSCRDIVYSTYQTDNTETNFYFQLGDLVKINGTNSVCYVLDVQKYSLKLIDTLSLIKKVSVGEIAKVNQRIPTGMDSKRNPITKDDTVKIIDGAYKGKRGVIRNIFKNFVFLYNQDFVSTNGIFVDKSENLEILGSELLSDYMSGGRVNIRKVPEELRRAVGALVRIIKGDWKGYVGVLKRVTDKNAAIELTSKNKTITIEINSIQLVEDTNQNKEMGWATPRSNAGVKTPAYYPQSPSYGMSVSSPAWNPAATPNYSHSPNSYFMSPGKNYK